MSAFTDEIVAAIRPVKYDQIFHKGSEWVRVDAFDRLLAVLELAIEQTDHYRSELQHHIIAGMSRDEDNQALLKRAAGKGGE